MRILGIDPGLAVVGLGLIEAPSAYDLNVVDWLTIRTPAGLSLSQRLLEISRDLGTYLDEAKPDLAVVERLFFETNVQTAIDVAHARGAILAKLAEHGIPVIEPTPLQLKLAITGDGKADKRQMQTMLPHLLKLKEIPRPVDAADALALAAYGAIRPANLPLSHTN
jgi:crossover junction endodeoxyribonuclease RuvC